MPTILEALTTPNLAVDDYWVVPGLNTGQPDRYNIAPDSWVPWTDFNLPNLSALFQRQLAREYIGESDPQALPKEHQITSEETFHDIIRRFVIPRVNYALHDRSTDSPFISRGSRCVLHDDNPDWSISMENPRVKNLVPGDTKLSKKFGPEMLRTNKREWRKVLLQVMNYMYRRNSRYGFIITDACLVVLKLSRQPVAAGIAAERPRRPQGHQRGIGSDMSMASGSSIGYTSDDAVADTDVLPPQYQVIPWTNAGPGTMTIKLALWFLAKLAVEGDETMGTGYSKDDWRAWVKDGRGFRHLQTGVRSQQLPPGHGLNSGPGPSLAGGPSGQQGSGQQQQRPQISQGRGYSGLDAVSLSGRGQPMPIRTAQTQGMQQLAPNANSKNPQPHSLYRDPAKSVPPVSSTNTRRRLRVKVGSSMTGKPTFENSRGKTVKTDRKHWQRVQGGYEYDLKGEECIYFTEQLP